MKKNFVIIALSAFILGICTSNFAMSDVPSTYKIGVIDLSKVVTSSKQVSNLKAQRAKKNAEMQNFIATAQKKVNNEKDPNKKAALVKKFEKDLTAMKNSTDKNYTKSLAEIDNSISKTIETESKKAGYDIVFAKSVVLYGGTDITNTIVKAVK